MSPSRSGRGYRRDKQRAGTSARAKWVAKDIRDAPENFRRKLALSAIECALNPPVPAGSGFSRG
jgi:hypothetical protein